MMNHNIQRIHIEQTILSTFLNQNRSLPLDEMELKDTNIPFEIFKASRLTKMTAKAIYNFKQEDKVIDEELIFCYITKHASVNSTEWLDIIGRVPVSFDTMITYLKMLKELDEEESKLKFLEDI